ncbi:MAG: M28 family peptidase [Butyrivibrio sp.]|nr:M28 family peptidase [Butyrivibrio sp.]
MLFLHAKKILAAITIIVMTAPITSFATNNRAELPEDHIPVSKASAVIGRLTSPVTSANRTAYDYTDKAMEYLEYIGTHLKDRGSRTPDSNEHDKAADWIVSELKAAGYDDDRIVEQEAEVERRNTTYKVRNIILTVPGEDESKQIIAGAHYDGDGVGDNCSGTALLLANAVGLKNKKPHYTVKYIFFDAEEVGLIGSTYYAENMTNEEVNKTIYMINLDALAFGDYANVYGGAYLYGGKYLLDDNTPAEAEGYYYAMQNAKNLGIKVQGPKELDGYFNRNGTGPAIENGTLYTNPWTYANPAPDNSCAFSPATIPQSDHREFMLRGIPYIYFEATNWFAAFEDDDLYAYTGYIETYDQSLGDNGMFMNTEYDTLENLESIFPGRVEAHYHMYSPLLSSLLLSE